MALTDISVRLLFQHEIDLSSTEQLRRHNEFGSRLGLTEEGTGLILITVEDSQILSHVIKEKRNPLISWKSWENLFGRLGSNSMDHLLNSTLTVT